MKKLFLALLLIPQLAYADRTFFSAYSLVPGATGGALTLSDAITFSATDKGLLVSGTDKRLLMYGGGSLVNGHASLALNGSTYSGAAGNIDLVSGAVAGSKVTIAAANATSVINFAVGAYATTRWTIDASGNLSQNVTNGGGIILAKTGTTIAVDSGTAASTCSGTVTANGATPVVTSTSCALTTSRIFLSKQSASTAVNGSCTVTAISNGVSFTIACLATDTGAYNFWITQEG